MTQETKGTEWIPSWETAGLSQSPVWVRKIRKRSIYHPLLIRAPFCGCFYTQGLGMHESLAAAAAKSLQSCLTLCNPKDGRPPGSSVPGILQARTLEWLAISFSSAWKWKVKVMSLSRVRVFTTPWTAAYQAPPSMGFSRQEYWSGVPSPSPKAE